MAAWFGGLNFGKSLDFDGYPSVHGWDILRSVYLVVNVTELLEKIPQPLARCLILKENKGDLTVALVPI